MKKLSLLTAISLTFLLLLSTILTAQASGQFLSTPTPGPDGRILWIVDEGQNCTTIAAENKITLDQLRSLNPSLDQSCSLVAGQKLVVGNGGPGGSTPTTGPAATVTPPAVTATPFPGTADVCVLLFDDQDGNMLHADQEPGIDGGAISISGSSGQYSKTATTTAAIDPPICFEKVPVGTYTISVAAPPGYNATTLLNYTLEVKPGDVQVTEKEVEAGSKVYVKFGAQKSSQVPTKNNPSGGGDDNTLMGIIGGVLLIAGFGLAFYAWRMYGRRPKYMPPPSPR
jgi:hypothetical protein